MKFRLTLKNPDGVSYAKQDAIESGIKKSVVEATLKPYVEFDEYVTIEFDTNNKSAKVLKI